MSVEQETDPLKPPKYSESELKDFLNEVRKASGLKNRINGKEIVGLPVYDLRVQFTEGPKGTLRDHPPFVGVRFLESGRLVIEAQDGSTPEIDPTWACFYRDAFEAEMARLASLG